MGEAVTFPVRDVYFIPMLRALGSDAVVTASGPRNLTREHLAD